MAALEDYLSHHAKKRASKDRARERRRLREEEDEDEAGEGDELEVDEDLEAAIEELIADGAFEFDEEPDLCDDEGAAEAGGWAHDTSFVICPGFREPYLDKVPVPESYLDKVSGKPYLRFQESLSG